MDFLNIFRKESGSPLLKKLRIFYTILSTPFIQREEEAEVIVLSLLSDEHTLFIGEPGCVAGDTIICGEDGRLYYIEDLAKNIVPGVYIADFPVFPPARATELHIYDVWETVEIITSHYGFRIRVTPNHPIMTDRGWVEARHLKPGHKVKIFNKLPSPSQYINIPNDEIMPIRHPFRRQGWRKIKEYKKVKRVKILDEKLAELLGIFVAEGYFAGTASIGFGIGIEEKDLEQRIIELMKDLFGLEPYRYWRRSPKKSRVKHAIILKYNSIYVTRLFRWLDHGHEVKMVPRWILASPKNVSAAFLRGLFEGDGTVSDYPRQQQVRLKSKSRKLLEAVQMLLLRHEILSSIYKTKTYDARCKKTYISHVLVIRGLDNLKKFQEEIGFISKHKKRKLEGTIKNRKRRSPVRNRGFDIIKEIHIIRDWCRVYDFYIPGTHSFFTNGLLSHNTAKSAIVRRAASLLKAKYFYYVLNKYTEPDEIFGPVDINELKNRGIYKRKIEGKLPLAEIAFLDEIFNANTAILNTLLSLLQERIFINGDEKIHSPLISLFSATNDVPEEAELRALYDRLVFRHYVRPVAESKLKDLFKAGIEIELKGVLEEKPIMEIHELKKTQKYVVKVLDGIKGNKRILQQYARLIVIFREQGIHVTDRRAIKGLKAIAAYAVFNGRTYVEPKDFMVLKYVIPETIEDFGKVAAIVSEEIKLPSRHLRDLEMLERNISRLKIEIRKLPSYDFKIINYSRELLIIERKLRRIAREAIDDDEVLNRVERLLEMISEIKDSLIRKSSPYGKDL